MKKFTHPLKKITTIQFKNGSTFHKYWVYYRTFIQDGGAFFSIAKLKVVPTDKKFNNSYKEKKTKVFYKTDETDMISEINKIKLYFK